MEIDQGFCKIYRISEAGYVGIVDETKGMHKCHEIKPVQICIRVPEVEPFYDTAKKQKSMVFQKCL